MSKKLLHALAVLFTILLFLVRRTVIKWRDNLMKKSEMEKKNFNECLGYGAGDTPDKRMCILPQSHKGLQLLKYCAMSLNLTGSDSFDDYDDASPKLKKDPDIIFDDEDIGKYPQEYY